MSGNKAFFDTNAVGIYLSNSKFAKNYLRKFTSTGISVLTQIEFLSNPQLTIKGKFLFEDFIKFIEIYPIIKDNKLLFLQAVSIRKKYKLKLPDAFLKIYNLKFQLINL